MPRLFRTLEPTFYAGLLDDPLLWVRMRPLGRSLLVDCGQIAHLAKRVIRAVDTLFITHCHMDHFMGMDTFVRHVHVAPRTIEIYGPPGIAERLEKKLAGYDWNLTEEHWCSFRAHEVHPGRLRTSLLPGPRGFERLFEGERLREGHVIFENACLQVEAGMGDHGLPVLFFRISEKPTFLIDEEKIERAGLVRGPWLRTLKKQFYRGTLGRQSLAVERRTGEGIEEGTAPDTWALYREIRGEEPPASIGYFTDVGWSDENREALAALLSGVTLLVGECTFLAEDRERARRSRHLCTADVNELLADLRPRLFLPMHLSKSYVRRPDDLYRELEPPDGTTVLRIPPHVPPRPLLPEEVPAPEPL